MGFRVAVTVPMPNLTDALVLASCRSRSAKAPPDSDREIPDPRPLDPLNQPIKGVTRCADHAAAGEHIENGVAGLLARYGDSDHFVEQSHRLISDRDLARSCRSAARLAAKKLDWACVVKRMEGVLIGAVEAPSVRDGAARPPVGARPQRRSARA